MNIMRFAALFVRTLVLAANLARNHQVNAYSLQASASRITEVEAKR
jgi:hypothetical protein